VLSFASPEKEKYFLFIYEVITWEKFNKRPSNYYWPPMPRPCLLLLLPPVEGRVWFT
jgi:hypothetical protein